MLSILKVACAQVAWSSKLRVLKVVCPQSRVSSMSHGPWQRPLSLFRQYLQRGLLYLPCEQCLAISILQQSARSCLSLLLRICQARKQSMFRTMFDKAKKGTKCKLTKSPCWGCVSDRHKGCWGDSPLVKNKGSSCYWCQVRAILTLACIFKVIKVIIM